MRMCANQMCKEIYLYVNDRTWSFNGTMRSCAESEKVLYLPYAEYLVRTIVSRMRRKHIKMRDHRTQ